MVYSKKLLNIIALMKCEDHRTKKLIQEVFHVYLNKFEIAVSHLSLIIFSNIEFTLINLISGNAQSPRK